MTKLAFNDNQDFVSNSKLVIKLGADDDGLLTYSNDLNIGVVILECSQSSNNYVLEVNEVLLPEIDEKNKEITLTALFNADTKDVVTEYNKGKYGYNFKLRPSLSFIVIDGKPCVPTIPVLAFAHIGDSDNNLADRVKSMNLVSTSNIECGTVFELSVSNEDR
ncbi:hypothetical protein VCHA53O466_50444 [Vibrio chagasii]|nr:hypothetical protein VCHA53O466_50444 [Vibrio chagasii]